jgi:hypothetical protein
MPESTEVVSGDVEKGEGVSSSELTRRRLAHVDILISQGTSDAPTQTKCGALKALNIIPAHPAVICPR